MTIPDYQPFVERMIARYEGNYGWDRADSGGPTKYGITCYDLAEEMHRPMNSMVAWAPIVRAMSLTTADAIYQKKYATACAFNALNAGCDCVVFDFGVNSGPSRSIKYAQAVVGVPIDGQLGPVTLAAINKYDPAMFVNQLCDRRMAFLRGLGNFRNFGRGWTARVADLRNYSLALQRPHPPTLMAMPQKKLRQINGAHAKAYHKEEIELLKSGGGLQ